MALNEFEIIEQLFNQLAKPNSSVAVGIGDDAAVINVPGGQQLVTSIDNLVVGVHFFEDVLPENLGHKALAVSLSDIAAMGADPNTALIALTLPEIDEDWLTRFVGGFFALADKLNVSLIGGDLTRGPLAISTVVNGFVPENQALLQKNARVDDLIYVTGHLGDAGIALFALQQPEMGIHNKLLQRLHCPTPRIGEGIALRGLANSAVDISDGLAADLNKILTASHVGAIIEVEKLPLSAEIKMHCSKHQAWQYALTAGDDYELCFTVSPKNKKNLEKVMADFDCGIHCIGKITKETGLIIHDAHGNPFDIIKPGYDHFS